MHIWNTGSVKRSQCPKRRRWWVALVLVFTSSFAGTGYAQSSSAALTWIQPTTNVDGTPLTDLAGHKIYSGCVASGQYELTSLSAGIVSGYQVTGLPDSGRCYFSVTAIDTSGNESPRSNEASKLMGPPPTDPEIGPVITWGVSPPVTIGVLQEGGTSTPNATSGARVLGSNVAVGSLIAVGVSRYSGSGSDPLVAGDCVASGTSVLSAVTLDSFVEVQYGAGAPRIQSAVFSARVLSAGSLTMTVSGNAGDYWVVAAGEYSGSWDSSRVEGQSTNSTAADGTTAAGSGNATSAAGALFFGVVNPIQLSAITITEDAAFTVVFEEEDGANQEPGSIIRRIVTTGTTDAADWTIGSGNAGWTAALAVYRESYNPVPVAYYYRRMIRTHG